MNAPRSAEVAQCPEVHLTVPCHRYTSVKLNVLLKQVGSRPHTERMGRELIGVTLISCRRPSVTRPVGVIDLDRSRVNTARYRPKVSDQAGLVFLEPLC